MPVNFCLGFVSFGLREGTTELWGHCLVLSPPVPGTEKSVYPSETPGEQLIVFQTLSLPWSQQCFVLELWEQRDTQNLGEMCKLAEHWGLFLQSFLEVCQETWQATRTSCLCEDGGLEDLVLWSPTVSETGLEIGEFGKRRYPHFQVCSSGP